jgi:hypothetical protein
MKVFVVVAGIPSPIYDDVVSIQHKKLVGEQGVLVSTPLRPQGGRGYIYTAGYLNDLIKSLWRVFAPAAASRLNELAILVVGLEHGNDSHSIVAERFFPFGWVCKMPAPFVDSEYGSERRRAKNAFLDALADLVGTQMQKLDALKHVLASKRTRTPLLLPIRNFRSAHLESLLRSLSLELPKVDDVRTAIGGKTSYFEARHPFVRVDGDNRSFFQDDRRMVFKSTGNHAFAADGLRDHRYECRFAGRTRLGAPYLAAFHYDCVMDRGKISGDFLNCHDVVETNPGSDYINIAPNDAIRIPGR